MLSPGLVPTGIVLLLVGLALPGCPSSVRVESLRSTLDAVPEAEVTDVVTDGDAITDGHAPDGDAGADVSPEVLPPCATDGDCDDLPGLDPCHVGRCVQGSCVTEPVPGCCRSDDDCVPADPTCREGRCPEPGQGCVVVDTCTACDADARCDDGEPCTADACVGGQCQHASRPNCCAADADCDDGQPCSRDTCLGHACVHEPLAGCCTTDTQCVPPPEKPCLAGVCHDHACAWKPRPDCCAADAACDDGAPCTIDACLNHACVHEPDPACAGCTADAQCADDDPCTQDRCQQGACVHTPDPACAGCTADAQCADADACTTDACQDGACVHAALPGCVCHVDADCADPNPCTKDRCQAGQCAHVAVPNCCEHPLDCSDGNPCTWDLCTDNTCYSYAATELPGCCADDTDCPQGEDPCAFAVCRGDFHCVVEVAPGCCTEHAVFAAAFDADTPGWTLLPPNKPVRWSVDPHRFASAPAALYFGNPNTLTYAIPGQASAGLATTPILALPAAALRLRFALWLDVESQPNVDRLEVRVLEGGSSSTIWQKTALAPSAYATWTEVEVSLSAWAGHAVRLQFAFDSVDALDNAGEGVIIDDLRLDTTCAP